MHIAVRAWPDLKKNGAQAVLDTAFPKCMSSKVEKGFDLALEIDCDKLPNSMTPELCAKKLSEVRFLIIGAPFAKALTIFKKSTAPGAKPSPSSIVLVDMHKATDNGGGSCYIVTKNEQMSFVFAVDFPEETDRAIAKIFLQEFVEAQRSVNGCPLIEFKRGTDPPFQVNDVKGITNTPDIAGKSTREKENE
jgi:actin related protein 2/3 complex subunit 2